MLTNESVHREFMKQIAVGTAVTLPVMAFGKPPAAETKKLSSKSPLFFIVADFGAVGDGKTCRSY